jgi:hypothetical protein
MKIPKNPEGMKFLMKNGRMGKVTKTYFNDNDNKLAVHVRSVDNKGYRNLYSYWIWEAFLIKNVIKWFKDNEIKIGYKKIIHYDKEGKELKPGQSSLSYKGKREWRYL